MSTMDFRTGVVAASSGHLKMRIALYATAALASSGLAAQTPHQVWLDAQERAAAPTAPTPAATARGSGGLQMFPDLAAFQAATTGISLVFEDFSARPANNVSPCYEPINSDMGQPGTAFLAPTCFSPSQVVPGFSVRSDLGTGGHGFGLTYFGGQITGAGSNVVGAISPAQATFLDFHDGPVAVAMDVFDWQAGSPLSFIVRGLGGETLGDFTLTPSSPTTPVFAGFISAEPILRVEIRSAASTTQMFSNLRFGGHPGGFAVSEQALRFGPMALDDDAEASVDLLHTGDLPVTVPALPAPAAPFAVAADGCSGQVLSVGASCTMRYVYAPDLERSDRTEIGISDPTGGETELVLSGRGVAPTLATSTEVLNFAEVEVGGSTVAAVVVSNPVAVALAVATISAPAEPFQIHTIAGQCPPTPFVLDPGQSCLLSYSFAPLSDGLHVDRVLIETNTPSSPWRLLLRGASGDEIFANDFEQH